MATYALMVLVFLGVYESNGQAPLQQPQQQQQQNKFLSSHGNPGGDPLKQQEQLLHALLSSGGCMPSADHCPCPVSYFHTPTGCHYCNCHGYVPGNNVLVSPPTPSASGQSTPVPIPPAPAQTTPHSATGITTTAPPTTNNRCSLATNLCHLNCPGGYLVDPSDCTFCVCKKDVLGK